MKHNLKSFWEENFLIEFFRELSKEISKLSFEEKAEFLIRKMGNKEPESPEGKFKKIRNDGIFKKFFTFLQSKNVPELFKSSYITRAILQGSDFVNNLWIDGGWGQGKSVYFFSKIADNLEFVQKLDSFYSYFIRKIVLSAELIDLSKMKKKFFSNVDKWSEDLEFFLKKVEGSRYERLHPNNDSYRKTLVHGAIIQDLSFEFDTLREKNILVRCFKSVSDRFIFTKENYGKELACFSNKFLEKYLAISSLFRSVDFSTKTHEDTHESRGGDVEIDIYDQSRWFDALNPENFKERMDDYLVVKKDLGYPTPFKTDSVPWFEYFYTVRKILPGFKNDVFLNLGAEYKKYSLETKVQEIYFNLSGFQGSQGMYSVVYKIFKSLITACKSSWQSLPHNFGNKDDNRKSAVLLRLHPNRPRYLKIMNRARMSNAEEVKNFFNIKEEELEEEISMCLDEVSISTGHSGNFSAGIGMSLPPFSSSFSLQFGISESKKKPLRKASVYGRIFEVIEKLFSFYSLISLSKPKFLIILDDLDRCDPKFIFNFFNVYFNIFTFIQPESYSLIEEYRNSFFTIILSDSKKVEELRKLSIGEFEAGCCGNCPLASREKQTYLLQSYLDKYIEHKIPLDEVIAKDLYYHAFVRFLLNNNFFSLDNSANFSWEKLNLFFQGLSEYLEGMVNSYAKFELADRLVGLDNVIERFDSLRSVSKEIANNIFDSRNSLWPTLFKNLELIVNEYEPLDFKPDFGCVKESDLAGALKRLVNVWVKSEGRRPFSIFKGQSLVVNLILNIVVPDCLEQILEKLYKFNLKISKKFYFPKMSFQAFFDGFFYDANLLGKEEDLKGKATNLRKKISGYFSDYESEDYNSWINDNLYQKGDSEPLIAFLMRGLITKFLEGNSDVEGVEEFLTQVIEICVHDFLTFVRLKLKFSPRSRSIREEVTYQSGIDNNLDMINKIMLETQNYDYSSFKELVDARIQFALNKMISLLKAIVDDIYGIDKILGDFDRESLMEWYFIGGGKVKKKDGSKNPEHPNPILYKVEMPPPKANPKNIFEKGYRYREDFFPDEERIRIEAKKFSESASSFFAFEEKLKGYGKFQRPAPNLNEKIKSFLKNEGSGGVRSLFLKVAGTLRSELLRIKEFLDSDFDWWLENTIFKTQDQ